MTHPIFIVGASRSGTTMLATMLGRHSTLHDIGETHYFGDLCSPDELAKVVPYAEAVQIAATLYARSRKTIWDSRPDLEDQSRAQDVLASAQAVSRYALFSVVANELARSSGKIRAVEQTPRNIYYADKILAHTAEVSIIEIVRDPRAVLHSQRQRWRVHFLGAPNVPYAESLRTFLNYHAITVSLLWRGAVRAGMTHTTDSRYLRIRYEDLVSEPTCVLDKICTFLDIPYEPEMLAIPRISSSTAMNASEKSGVSKDSIDIWRNQLPSGDRALCARLVGREARLLGYDISKEPLLRVFVLWHLLRYPFHIIGSLIANPGRILIQLDGLRQSFSAR